MAIAGLLPRRAALRLLDGVTTRRRMLSELAPQELSALSGEERARALRLAASGLRWAQRADRLLGPYLKRRPPQRVLNILRLAVVELFEERAAAHGVVSSWVSVTRAGRQTARLAGLVNAVLRQVAALPRESWEALPLPRMPGWLRRPLLAAHGKAVVEAIEAAHAAGAPLDLTVRDAPDAWARRLGGRLMPTGSVRLGSGVQVSALPGYDSGAWWVQDAAAALPVRLLAPRPGERVLDMCAAPGGKTMQLAAAGADVTALDSSARRMRRLRENLERTGLTARPVVADALGFRAPPFDAILLDAPCSATGTMRRHPDLPHVRGADSLPALLALQRRLLDHALTLLRPGGRLVYCTCSLLPDEGEAQLRALLQRAPRLWPDGDAIAAAIGRGGFSADWRRPEGLRTRPDHWADAGGLDGFFMAVLRVPDEGGLGP